MGKLIKRITGLCLLISSLPGSVLRSLAMSTSILKALLSKDTHLVFSIDRVSLVQYVQVFFLWPTNLIF